jgi:hypothetical protein
MPEPYIGMAARANRDAQAGARRPRKEDLAL